MTSFEQEYGLRPTLDQWQFTMLSKLIEPPKGVEVMANAKRFAREMKAKWRNPFR